MFNAALVALAAVALTGTAHAASVTYALDQSNALPDGVSWATVKIDSVGSDIQFTVSIQPQASYYAPASNFGLQSFAFNSSAVLTASNLILPSGWSLTTDKNVSGFGRFEYLLKGTGYSRQNPLSFTIKGMAGDLPENYFELSTGAADQGKSAFAAHLADFTSDKCTGASANCSSAFIGGGKLVGAPAESVPAVPLPASVWLLGSAVLGLLGVGRRHRSV
jgi:hypothetical protein